MGRLGTADAAGPAARGPDLLCLGRRRPVLRDRRQAEAAPPEELKRIRNIRENPRVSSSSTSTTRTGARSATSSSRGGPSLLTGGPRVRRAGPISSSRSTRSTARMGLPRERGLMITRDPETRQSTWQLLRAEPRSTAGARAAARRAGRPTPTRPPRSSTRRPSVCPCSSTPPSALRDRGHGRATHLLGQGLHPAHHALPRLLRLLHLPEGSRASRAPSR